MPDITYESRPLSPFRLDFTVWALRRRAENALDLWDAGTYRRLVIWNGKTISMAVRQSPSEKPLLEINATGAMPEAELRAAATATVNRILGLQIDLTPFYRLSGGDDKLKHLTEKFRGLKPPRFPTIFETLVNGISCQQISLAAGIHLLNQLAKRYGHSSDCWQRQCHAFPEPAALAKLQPEELRKLGFSRQKARAIIELASSVDDGFDLEHLSAMGDDKVLKALYGLHGVGRWTAEYALLRGLGRLHIFPGDDVGARKKLRRVLGLSGNLDYNSVERILSSWAPYAGFIYFHLLLEELAEGGYLQ